MGLLINPRANADQRRGSSEGSAAGSFSQETGFWFVLHHVPTGPSAGMYSPGYSEHMPMGKFSNNRAHSNYRVSLHATGMLPSKKHHFLAPTLRVCKLLMPVLSVSLKVHASLFVSADKAARMLAWEHSESASTRFNLALGHWGSSLHSVALGSMLLLS